jgi:hypothetical protein
MNCQETQARLSEYLEESLDPTAAKQVESHLSSCRLCRAEADGLALCIQQVTELPIVEPPMGFAQRVMSHVRELEKQPRFWERLLFPLNLKIPIHATALVLIGILAVYLFEKEGHRKNSLQTTEQVTSPKKSEQAEPSSPADSPFATGQRKPTSLPRQQPDFSLTGKEQRAEKDLARRSAPSKIPGPAQSPSTPAPSAKESIDARALSEESGPSLPQAPFSIQSRGRVGEVISGTPVVNPMMPRMGTGQFSLRSEAETESLRAGSLSIAPLADYELVVRRRASQQDQTLRDHLIPQSGSVAAERMQTVPRSVERLIAMIPDSGKPHIVWISLAPSQFEQFKKDLNSLGTIESESATAFRDLEFASKTDSEILIKLAILPASEASRSNPMPRGNR